MLPVNLGPHMLLQQQQQQTGHAPSTAGGSDCTIALTSRAWWPAFGKPCARRARRARLCLTAGEHPKPPSLQGQLWSHHLPTEMASSGAPGLGRRLWAHLIACL